VGRQVYVIAVRTATAQWTTCRRFSEFDALHQKARLTLATHDRAGVRKLTCAPTTYRYWEQIKRRFGRVPRDLPKKSPTVKLKHAAMQERARQLEEYLQAIVQREPLILQCDDMMAFLEVQLYDVHGICYMLLANLVPDGLGMSRPVMPGDAHGLLFIDRLLDSTSHLWGR